MSHSVILRRCATLHEALVCYSLLIDRGILASLDNAEHAGVDWGMVSCLGGVHIRVPTSQYETAKQIIIEQVTDADEILTHAGLTADPVPKKSRWRAISMLVIYFGLFQLVASLGLIWLDQFIPRSWLPVLNSQEPVAYFWTGTSAAPPGPGVDGVVFVFFLVLLTISELISTRQKTPNREPQV